MRNGFLYVHCGGVYQNVPPLYYDETVLKCACAHAHTHTHTLRVKLLKSE